MLAATPLSSASVSSTDAVPTFTLVLKADRRRARRRAYRMSGRRATDQPDLPLALAPAGLWDNNDGKGVHPV